jgi:hypothetical protein
MSWSWEEWRRGSGVLFVSLPVICYQNKTSLNNIYFLSYVSFWLRLRVYTTRGFRILQSLLIRWLCFPFCSVFSSFIILDFEEAKKALHLKYCPKRVMVIVKCQLLWLVSLLTSTTEPILFMISCMTLHSIEHFILCNYTLFFNVKWIVYFFALYIQISLYSWILQVNFVSCLKMMLIFELYYR